MTPSTWGQCYRPSGAEARPADNIRNRVHFDIPMSMSAHVSQLVWDCYYQLRRIKTHPQIHSNLNPPMSLDGSTFALSDGETIPNIGVHFESLVTTSANGVHSSDAVFTKFFVSKPYADSFQPQLRSSWSTASLSPGLATATAYCLHSAIDHLQTTTSSYAWLHFWLLH